MWCFEERAPFVMIENVGGPEFFPPCPHARCVRRMLGTGPFETTIILPYPRVFFSVCIATRQTFLVLYCLEKKS